MADYAPVDLMAPGQVEFELDGDSVRIRKAQKSRTRGDAVLARLRGTATSGLTTDQILALTRD